VTDVTLLLLLLLLRISSAISHCTAARNCFNLQ
jgi:hypothetical protein